MKVSLELETLEADHLVSYGGLCGAALARAHAKAGKAQEIAGYLGTGAAFDDALGRYANGYADLVERDYQAFRDTHGPPEDRDEQHANRRDDLLISAGP